jgi:hypothetical protein
MPPKGRSFCRMFRAIASSVSNKSGSIIDTSSTINTSVFRQPASLLLFLRMLVALTHTRARAHIISTNCVWVPTRETTGTASPDWR